MYSLCKKVMTGHMLRSMEEVCHRTVNSAYSTKKQERFVLGKKPENDPLENDLVETIFRPCCSLEGPSLHAPSLTSKDMIIIISPTIRFTALNGATER
jgi:hypothetical protein